MKLKKKAKLDSIYLTDIGWLMVRIYYPEDGMWIKYPIYNIHTKKTTKWFKKILSVDIFFHSI